MDDRHYISRFTKTCSHFGVACFFGLTSLLATNIQLPSGVTVNLEEKKVSFSIVYVGQKSGLEFLVTKGMDKDYEALFSANITGRDLHMALLMVGLEPEKQVEAVGKKKSEDDVAKKDEASSKEMTVQKGTPVVVEVIHQGQAKSINHFLEWSDGKVVGDLGLFFLGSRFINDGERSLYGADVSLNLVGAWRDADMVVGPSVEVGSPYDDEGPSYLVPSTKVQMSHLQKAKLIIRLKP